MCEAAARLLTLCYAVSQLVAKLLVNTTEAIAYSVALDLNICKGLVCDYSGCKLARFLDMTSHLNRVQCYTVSIVASCLLNPHGCRSRSKYR